MSEMNEVSGITETTRIIGGGIPSEIHRVDVLVVGAGTAGCFAAMAAASEGARVLLLERDFAPGGVGIRAGVHVYWYGSTGGYQHTIDKLTHARAKQFGVKSLGFHPDAKRTVLGEALLDDNIEVIFGAIVYEVLVSEGTVYGVKAATADGLLEVHASVVIDSTGDGDIAAGAGAAYESGRPEDGITHVYSLVPRVVEHSGKIDNANFDAGWVDPTDPWDLSEAYREGRKHISDMLAEDTGTVVGTSEGADTDGASVKGTSPEASTNAPAGTGARTGTGAGFARLLSISPQIGIRESRRIQGRYVITFDDLVMNRRFNDRIMSCFTHYDNHGIDQGNESIESQIWKNVLKLGRQQLICDIPYRSLLPQGIDGLLLACRAISLDRDAAAGIRMQRDMQKIGEAAGTAAALCVKCGVTPDQLDISILQARLIARGLLKADDMAIQQKASQASLQVSPQAPLQTLSQIPLQAPPNVQFDHSWLAGIRIVDSEHAEQHLEDILSYLGGEEEGRALWWLRQIGGQAVEALLSMVDEDQKSDGAKRAAIYALGLIGREESAPYLLQLVCARKGSVGKSLPDWMAAMILLRSMKHRIAFQEALAILHEAHPAPYMPSVLRYLSDIADQLNEAERAQAVEQIHLWLGKADLGSDYVMPRGKRTVPFRWSLDLSAAQLLAKLGDHRAGTICEVYTKSDRKFMRIAAAKTLQGIQATQAAQAEQAAATQQTVHSMQNLTLQESTTGKEEPS
jgi:hypothetical protein